MPGRSSPSPFRTSGNVGVNDEDIETVNMAAASGVRGCIIRTDISQPSNYRATRNLDAWLKARGIVGLAGIDTRALTSLIRSKGMPNAVIIHDRGGAFDRATLTRDARAWPGLVGMDLAKEVTTGRPIPGTRLHGRGGQGYGRLGRAEASRRRRRLRHQAQHPQAARRPRLPRDRGAGDGDRRGHSRPPAGTACSSRTGRATRRRPAPTRCRRSGA